MSGSKLRVGLIGGSPGGSWGTTAHIPALQSLPRYAVSAVCTAHQDTAFETAKLFNIPHAFADPAELVTHPEVDIVAVNVRVPAHYELVMAAIDAGKHVFCEWPLAVDTTQARRLLAAAQAKGITHMIGLQSRASPALNYVRDLVQGGEIGELVACSMLHSLPWRTETTRAMAYLQDKSTGATFMSIPGGHSIDALRFCVGEIAEVSALVDTRVKTVTVTDPVSEAGRTIPRTSPDEIAAHGRLANGAVFSVHMQGGPGAGSGFRFEINGTKADLVITGRTTVQMADLHLHRTRHGAAMEELDVPVRYRWTPPDSPAGRPFNVAQLYVKLAEAIDSGRPAQPNFGTAVEMHRLLDAIQMASDTGQRQTFRV
jgi:predicted dehydrogenase